LRSASRLALACAALALLGGCKFNPRVPDAVISCTEDSDCPSNLVCQPQLQRCCRAGGCAELPNTAPTPDRSDGGSRPTSPSPSPAPSPSTPGAAVDAEPAPPSPGGDEPDGGTSVLDGGALAETGGGGSATPITCAGTDAVPELGPGRQSFCTIYARSSDVSLAIHSMLPGDAVSTRSYGVCSARLPLLQEVSGTSGRAISAASIQALLDISQQYKALCARHNATMVGLVANQWARLASNVAEVRDKLHTGAGLDLDVLTPANEAAQSYLGVTRHRRGRVLVFETNAGIDLVYWPKGAGSLTWSVGTVGWTDVEQMYVASPTNLVFEDTRRALRGRLVREMQAPLTSIRGMVAAGTLDPGVVIGPADATVPLAVRGGLRDARGNWDSVDAFEKKRDAALVSPSPYGRIFGAAPLAPGEIDGFFGTLDSGQWRQLRENPVRSAYGYELVYVTVLLDVLADETKASEFAFVFASNHLGYLFAKVLPPPL
jgi:hypothetical protein